MPDTPKVSPADVDGEQVCLRFTEWIMLRESFSQQRSENCKATRISLGNGLRDAVSLQLQRDLLERDGEGRVLTSYGGTFMNAEMIAAWAVENGFLRIGLRNYRRHDNAGVITIEIKRLSYLLIDERQGSRPRLVSRLFKDMALPRLGASLQVLSLNGSRS